MTDILPASLPTELMSHPDFEQALQLALRMLNEDIVPLVVETWAEAEVTHGI